MHKKLKIKKRKKMSNKIPKTYEEQLEILKKMGIPKRWKNIIKR